MEINFYKSTGVSLIIGSFLAIATMTLHPAGGNLEHLIHISLQLQITHALAIFSLPFILFGFYGLTQKLSNQWRISTLAFIIIALGLFTAMLAALFNGLALPYFLEKNAGNIESNNFLIKAIVNYGFSINKALDYVFIVAFCMAIFIYSIIVIISEKLPKWIGYFGILIMVFALIGVATNFVFINLTGFRIVVFSIAVWILSSGIHLYKTKK